MLYCILVLAKKNEISFRVFRALLFPDPKIYQTLIWHHKSNKSIFLHFLCTITLSSNTLFGWLSHPSVFMFLNGNTRIMVYIYINHIIWVYSLLYTFMHGADIFTIFICLWMHNKQPHKRLYRTPFYSPQKNFKIRLVKCV